MNDVQRLREVLRAISELASSSIKGEGGTQAPVLSSLNQGSRGSEPLVCLPKFLPRHQLVEAAKRAAAINPVNRPPLEQMRSLSGTFDVTPERIALITSKYWGTGGVHLTVRFLDGPATDLRARILSHMNAWGATANVEFFETATDGEVRIARTRDDGYWSYVGTDILSIPADQPTMNLDSFTMNTPDSEFHRVVRHEAGHTLGFTHEHMRRELVQKIDPAKAIAYFRATQGWSEQEVRQQVLTPIEESSLMGTAHADPRSIMCYQIPGSITFDGNPILGGLDIDSSDYAFAAGAYPKTLSASSNPTLVDARIRFHTNNEDKDDDTHVSVSVEDFDQVVAARISNDFGHFDDNSDNGPFGLEVINASTKDSMQRGRVTVRIDPNGNDTWRFNFFLQLVFSDNTSLAGSIDGLELSQDRRQQTFGLQGLVHPAQAKGTGKAAYA